MANYEKFYQPEFIESYVRGLSNKIENETMQQLLQNDVALQAEVDFQRELLTAIADSRKQDLKKLLQNTPIPAYQPLYQKPLVQIAATLVGVAVLVTAILLQKPVKKVEQVEALKKEKRVQEQEIVVPKIVVPETEEKAKVSDHTAQSSEATKKAQSNLPKETKENSQKNSPFLQEVYYQYDGGVVLQLFGDFSYELLENLDVGAGKKTYIYIQNQFYELIPTAADEVRNLKEGLVKDKEQIRLLSEHLPKK
ncbi:MAG: hypothetical protein OHK0045_03350 [Raineya sp.]